MMIFVHNLVFVVILGIFSKSYFTFWVTISIIWGLIASFVIVLMPVWEYRHELVAAFTPSSRSAKQEHIELNDLKVLSLWARAMLIHESLAKS